MIDTVGKEKPEDNLSYFVTSQEMRTGLFPKISIYSILITFKRANLRYNYQKSESLPLFTKNLTGFYLIGKSQFFPLVKWEIRCYHINVT
jgi:hypothetical protein